MKVITKVTITVDELISFVAEKLGMRYDDVDDAMPDCIWECTFVISEGTSLFEDCPELAVPIFDWMKENNHPIIHTTFDD